MPTSHDSQTCRCASVAALLIAAAGAGAQELDSSRAASNELYSDAIARTSELFPAATAYAPKLGGLVVSRFNINMRDNAAPAKDWTIGGQMAYTKINMTGNVLDDSITYRLQVKFGEADGLPVLDDAYGDVKFEDEFSFRWGQFKPPVLREENISDSKQLAANRSVMNSVFSQSRTQGVMLTYAGQDTRIMASFNDGIRTPNLDYVATSEGDYGVTARAEYKIDGDWKQYEEFTSWKDSKYFGAVGGAIHYQEGGATLSGTGRTTNTDIVLSTVDAMAKGNGWNAYTALVYRRTATNGSVPTPQTLEDIGFLVQGGWFVGPKWELFARYDLVMPDNERALDASFSTITFGANKYISPSSHAVKLTLDAQWFLDNQSAQGLVTQNTLTGVLSSTERNQIALRAQLQLAF